MYLVNKELFALLPEESRKMIEEQGVAVPEPGAEGGEGAEGPAVVAPTTSDSPTSPDQTRENKPTDETMLPKATKYGDESQFEDKLTSDGKMEELPDSKKNDITDFQSANERGNALIDELSKPKKKGKKDQEADSED